MESLAYIHSKNVCHRDIKPENLMVCPNSKSLIKLIDFGFASFLDSSGTVTGSCGSPSYVAPEILSKSPYNTKCDVWSIGIIMYLMIYGELPFYADDQKEQFRLIREMELPDQSND